MMSSRMEKIATAACAVLILLVALLLIAVGSFVPKWYTVKNSTSEGNVSYSLWTRYECFGVICTTDHVRVHWTKDECWEDKQLGREVCQKTQGYKLRHDTTCREANYCNSTWLGEAVNDTVPSLVFVAKAFETPAMCSAVLAILLYVVKIVLLVKKPNVRRLHLKAAYLTFGAIAGFASVVGIIIFCVMLDKNRYNLHWAPYLNCGGGGLYIFFGVGGYLSWRNRAADDFDDDRSEFEKEFSDVKTSRPFLDRQTSRTLVRASEAQV